MADDINQTIRELDRTTAAGFKAVTDLVTGDRQAVRELEIRVESLTITITTLVAQLSPLISISDGGMILKMERNRLAIESLEKWKDELDADIKKLYVWAFGLAVGVIALFLKPFFFK